MFRVVLDAGHGLFTSGKRCMKIYDRHETREWWLNNRICDRIEELLNAYDGYKLLRVDDTTGEIDVPLQTRTDMANSWKGEIYLSVHHNAGLYGKNGGGAVTIVHQYPTDESLKYQEIIHKSFVDSVGVFGNRAEPMLKQNLHVLRETDMPAVLIECGFMDSPTDVPLILSEEFAEKAAQGLTNALVKIGGLTKKEDDGVEEKFVDIKGHYAEKAIQDLYEFGIVNGVSENEFAPDAPLTRGQAAIMVRNVIRYITGK